MAVEFATSNTYLFWIAELPVDTVFKCPLPWWCLARDARVVRLV